MKCYMCQDGERDGGVYICEKCLVLMEKSEARSVEMLSRVTSAIYFMCCTLKLGEHRESETVRHVGREIA